jgi:hypothetical protein
MGGRQAPYPAGMDTKDVLPWLPAVAILAAAVWNWLRLRAERQRTKVLEEQNAVLRQQAAIAEQQLAAVRPRSDVRIVDLEATGGGQHANFVVQVQNFGNQPTRATVSAFIGDQNIRVNPTTLELLVNAVPGRASIMVPRPELGDLVKELNSETTLYGRRLHVRVAAGEQIVERTWSEKRYDPETERGRYEAQQIAWRRGRGEETDADRRAEALGRAEELLG